MNLDGLRIALVGPLPPPEGGMANQTQQLGELLRREGAQVTVIRVNAPYRPAFVGKLRGMRAVFRLVPYVARLWQVGSRVDVYHVMANSGWSWHLFAAPAVWIARLRGVPVVVNYRGGEAESFLRRSSVSLRATLHRASLLAVPSGFLEQVFGSWGIESDVVPNIVDTERFRPAAAPSDETRPRLVVARNLERIYDIDTALRAFAIILRHLPGATLAVAGSGPEEPHLRSLAEELGVAHAVEFRGRLDRDAMAELYRSASVVLNPSRVDNMPNSVLEAMASGAPLVTTNVGGIPYIVRDGVTALLVAAGDHVGMAAAARRVLSDPRLADRLRAAALTDVQQYTWARIRERWSDVYRSVLPSTTTQARGA